VAFIYNRSTASSSVPRPGPSSPAQQPANVKVAYSPARRHFLEIMTAEGARGSKSSLSLKSARLIRATTRLINAAREREFRQDRNSFRKAGQGGRGSRGRGGRQWVGGRRTAGRSQSGPPPHRHPREIAGTKERAPLSRRGLWGG
jgi:hypothetical protein